MEDNSPAASSSRTGLVGRFRSDVSQGELSIGQLLESEEASPGRPRRHLRPLFGSEERLQKSVAKVQEPEAIKKLEHKVQEPPEEEVRVDLEDPAALATFLVTANIKLIRAEYLVHLVTQDRRLPRRQEAEGENFVDFAGKTRSALVDHEEVQAWAAGSWEAIIVSVSHAWEAREHPDPCGYQLEWVAQHASLFVAAFAADIWLFFDYVSLFQFKREKEAEEQSFRRSMGNMHAMYAHESTMTFRLESLTPEERWQKAVKDGSQVTIFHFHHTSGLVEPVPLHALTRNTNAYLKRGWCRAEVSWSSARGDTAQNQRIDVGSEEIHRHLTGVTPVAPDVFAADMHSAVFTHRSDADAVIELQKKVFLEKVTRRQKLKLEGVSANQMQALTQSLRHFKQLKSITLIDFRCDAIEANAFMEALAGTPIDKISLRPSGAERSLISFSFLRKALFAALASKSLKATQLDLSRMPKEVVLKDIAASLKSITTITDLDLSGNYFGNEEAEVLAEALKENRSLKRLNLAHNRIGTRGVEDIAASLKSNTIITDLDLSGNATGIEGAEALSEALQENRSLKRLNLAHMRIEVGGVKALEKSLETNTTLERLELDEPPDEEQSTRYRFPAAEAIDAACRANPRICKPANALSEASDGTDEASLKSPFEASVGIKGLADQLRLYKILTRLSLRRQNICDAKMKALADAFRVNKSVTIVDLCGNNFGDKGLQALADALRVNRTITEVNLSMNNFGDEGLKALASAMEVNGTITEVMLNISTRRLSDEGHQVMLYINRFCSRNKELQEKVLRDQEVRKLEAAVRNRR